MDVSILMTCVAQLAEELTIIEKNLLGGHRPPRQDWLPIVTSPKFFEQYCRSEREMEYRIYGERWNERICYIGRPVLVINKEDTRCRVKGDIVGFKKSRLDQSKGREDFLDMFGHQYPAGFPIAEIQIKTQKQQTVEDQNTRVYVI